jgi:putative IMPACT (imprinted ancient) family translation regulator
MRKNIVSILWILSLVAVIVVCVTLFGGIQAGKFNHNEKNGVNMRLFEINTSPADIKELRKDYNNLRKDYTQLKTKYEKLLDDYNKLKEKQ